MWQIYEHKRVPKQLKKLPKDVLKKYEIWKEIVALSGPLGLKRIKGLNDEGLRGQWKGCRSSRLNKQYRVIYEVLNDEVRVLVMEVTPHDYRKK